MPRKGKVTRPRIEPMLMIKPSRFWRMEGSTARVTRSSPMTFVSKITFACSAVKASVTPTDAMPALLTSTSILPASASTFLTPPSTDASSLTSNSTVLMPSLRRASAASRFLPRARRMEAYTVWPARNRVSAVSRPKPLLAPVIRIVLDILGLLESNGAPLPPAVIMTIVMLQCTTNDHDDRAREMLWSCLTAPASSVYIHTREGGSDADGGEGDERLRLLRLAEDGSGRHPVLRPGIEEAPSARDPAPG